MSATEDMLWAEIVTEARVIRELLANIVEDLDATITGTRPENFDAEGLIKGLRAIRTLNNGPWLAQMTMVAVLLGSCSNREAMVQKALKLGVVTPEEVDEGKF